jgi:Flp pilus assembly pilin Flp
MTFRNRSNLRRLPSDQSGATIVEFALALPVIAALLMGGLEMARQSYLQSVLYGAVQKAGRDGTLETVGSNATANDNSVGTVVKMLAKHGSVHVSRKSHATFKRAGQPEKFTDGNANNTRDALECYEDANGNGTWDTIGGKAGTGGADDIVVYTFSLTYDRTLPVSAIGWNQTNTLKATTVLRNQPFSNQVIATPAVICT